MPFKPRIQRVIFRDLTDDTEGNATGIGMADVVLRQAVDKIDPVTDLHEHDHRQGAAGRPHPDDRRYRPPGALHRRSPAA